MFLHVQVLAAAKMECFHGKPASCSTTKKGSFWFCGQKPRCGFICTEDEGYAFQRALEAWRNTNIEQPICDIHHRHVKFRVVKNTFRKKAMEDLILHVQTAKIHVLSGCGLTRIKSRNQTVITDSKQ